MHSAVVGVPQETTDRLADAVYLPLTLGVISLVARGGEVGQGEMESLVRHHLQVATGRQAGVYLDDGGASPIV
jgi:hypothetical protein